MIKHFSLVAFFALLNNVVLSQKDTLILYNSGEIHFAGQIKDGIEFGTWYEYSKTADTITRIEFLNSTQCKMFTISRDTNIIEYYYGDYESDSIIKNGRYLSENKLTEQKIEGRYFENYPEGLWRYYDRGRLKYIIEFKTGRREGLDITFQTNESIDKLMYRKDGMVNGLFIEFDKYDQIKYFGNYCNGSRIGEWYFYKNGKMEIKGSYYPDYLYFETMDGGTPFLVTKDGTFAEEIYCKQVINSYFENKEPVLYIKDGKWEYYSETGDLIKKEIYDKGRLLQSKTYKIKKNKAP
jgi:antitoxin component YwqK of YwqJK toxin-antitoxin module